MRLPNSYGSVTKMKGKRRNPWRARVPDGKEVTDRSIKYKYKNLGYYSNRSDALQALAAYHTDPYSFTSNQITFNDLFEVWSRNRKYPRTYDNALNKIGKIRYMKLSEITVIHVENLMADESIAPSTRNTARKMIGRMFRYANNIGYVSKNPVAGIKEVKYEPVKARSVFTPDEIELLWENRNIRTVDQILFSIYSGVRPSESCEILKENIHLDENYLVGGMKTEAGKNRTIPIHEKIRGIVENAMRNESEYLFPNQSGRKMSYEMYHTNFVTTMKELGMKHLPHDTRHTFITCAKESKISDGAIKAIVGHSQSDITESVYTHRSVKALANEMNCVKFVTSK